jgi:TPR repeat protein
MSQRITLDRPSFEQVLCATSLIQQLNRQVRYGRTPDQDAPHPLSDMVEAQLAIEAGGMDVEAAMNRVVDLALKLSRATGAATWLIGGHQFVYRAGSGANATENDTRWQLETLSELASIRVRSEQSLHDPRESNHWNPAYDAIHYPGSVKSLLVVPIYHGRSIAGALAVFSVEFNAFTELDATNARLLSGLLTHALNKAAEAELKQNLSLERATMLQAIDQLIPALRKVAEKEKQESRGLPSRLPSLCTELEPESEEPGDAVLEKCDSPSAPAAVTDKTEFERRDRLPQKGTEQTREVADNSSPPAYLAPEPTQAPESTWAPVPPNLSTLRIWARAAAARIRKNSPLWALPSLTELARRQLRKAGFWLSTAMDTLVGLRSIAAYQMRISVPAGLRLKPPALSTKAVPAVVLLIMLVPLFLITRASRPSKAAVVTSEMSAAAKLVPVSESSSQGLHQRSGPVPAYPLSHMQVTDPAMSSALRNLSRYEIVGLRRRAMYGDDSAALLLGMASETGYLVSQNCIKAGEWITQSANEGNAAAQYNLGLRYRQGDGEPVNQEVAVTWLRKAAAQKYSPAQLALESVP